MSKGWNNKLNRFAAGIVLYNPDLDRLKDNIYAIYEKVELLVLVDNASDNFEKIKDMYSANSKILFICNDKNLGIATALNQIMKCGLQKGFNWILTLDQDSICPDNLLEEYEKLIEFDKTAIISPKIIDRNIETNYSHESQEPDFEKIKKCITSGSLVNTNIWNQIGGFDDAMFIDEVDFEFCIRVINSGFCIIRANKTKLLHEIGHITVRRFLFWNVTVKNHNAFRKYHIAKNVVYVAKKNSTYRGIIMAYLRILKIMSITILYESRKREKIISIVKGLRDSREEINLNKKV